LPEVKVKNVIMYS